MKEKSLIAFKIVDRNLYLRLGATIANPFAPSPGQRYGADFVRKRELFRAVMDYVVDQNIPSTTACRIVKSQSHGRLSHQPRLTYKRIHIFLVCGEKEAAVLRLYFPDLPWKRWSQNQLEAVSNKPRWLKRFDDQWNDLKMKRSPGVSL